MLKKNLHRYMSGKKNSNPRGLGKKFLPKINHPYPLPHKSQMGNHIGGGDRCHPSTKWLARVHHVVAFKCKVLHFKNENKPIKDASGKRKFKRVLRFLFVDKRELFAFKFSFEESNLVFFTADQSAWLGLNQPRQRGF